LLKARELGYIDEFEGEIGKLLAEITD